MSNRTYLFANSFPSIIEASEIVKFEKLIIITSNEIIIEFCTKLNVEHINIGKSKNTSIKELLRHKKTIKRKLSKISDQDVLFCFYGFDLFGLFAIKELNRRNNVFFNNKDNLYKKTSHLRFWRRRISVNNYLIYSFLLNIPLRQFEITDKRTFLGVCYKKLEKKFPSLKSISRNDIFLHNSCSVRKLLNIDSGSVVIVDSGNYLFNLKKEYFLWIKRNFKNHDLYLKPHPNFNLPDYNLDEFKIIEKCIPAELIIDKTLIIISVIGTTLFHKFPFNVRKYSLINHVEWKDNEEYHRCYSNILNNKSIQIIENEK